MGIYPERDSHLSNGGKTLTTTVKTPGLKITQVWELAVEITDRTDCFCCSCGDDSYSHDYACRNHGYEAKRPCEVHNMPGSEDDDGVMPESVQEVRRKERERNLHPH